MENEISAIKNNLQLADNIKENKEKRLSIIGYNRNEKHREEREENERNTAKWKKISRKRNSASKLNVERKAKKEKRKKNERNQKKWRNNNHTAKRNEEEHTSPHRNNRQT